jgi:hypothetical protein
MTDLEFKKACRLAFDTSVDLRIYFNDALMGFGLPDFKPVLLHLEEVAECIRWQCLCLDGSIDQKNLAECRLCFVTLKRVQIVNSPEGDRLLAAALARNLGVKRRE